MPEMTAEDRVIIEASGAADGRGGVKVYDGATYVEVVSFHGLSLGEHCARNIRRAMVAATTDAEAAQRKRCLEAARVAARKRPLPMRGTEVDWGQYVKGIITAIEKVPE